MRLFVTLSKRSLAVILAAVIVTFIIIGQVFSADSGKIEGSTNALRMTYIKSLGLDADDSAATSKEIVIPQDFSEVYKEYNLLQKKSGFDLSHYKGEKATVYTYPSTTDKETEIHLIVHNGCIIGGDIASVSLNGEMKSLK